MFAFILNLTFQFREHLVMHLLVLKLNFKMLFLNITRIPQSGIYEQFSVWGEIQKLKSWLTFLLVLIVALLFSYELLNIVNSV